MNKAVHDSIEFLKIIHASDKCRLLNFFEEKHCLVYSEMICFKGRTIHIYKNNISIYKYSSIKIHNNCTIIINVYATTVHSWAKLLNTPQLIYMSLNKNNLCCIPTCPEEMPKILYTIKENRFTINFSYSCLTLI